MKNKSWIDRINPFKGNTENLELKALQDRLDALVDERDDTNLTLDIKSLDMSATGNSSEGSGVEGNIDVSALMRVYCSETWVYSAITAVAETLAGLPIKLEKAKKVNKTVKNEVTGENETIEQKVWIDASGEKLFDCFQYPNKYTTKSEFFMMLIIDLLSTGEYFIYLDAANGVDLTTIDMTADNNPDSPFGRLRTLIAADAPIKGMYRIPPNVIKPVVSADKKSIEGYAQLTEDGSFAYGAAEIIHVKLPNPLNPFRGLAPLVAAFKQVLIDKFSTEHMIRFYQSGARLGGVIETSKDLNKEQMARFQRSFENNYTGKQNHHRTLILPPGMKYSPVEQNPAETSLLEFSKYNREAILSIFRVPPIKVGIMDGANYANARAQLQTFFSDCIRPKVTFIEDGFNLKACLMPDNRSYRFKFDLSEVSELKEDLDLKSKTGASMLQAGLTVDEVRRDLWKKDPIPGGDKSPAVEAMTKPAAPAWGLSAPKPEVETALPVEAPKPESKVCETCKKDPCECQAPEPTKSKQSLAEFITESLAKLDPSEPVDAALLNDLVAIFNTRDGVPSDTAKEIMPEAPMAEAQIQADATTLDQPNTPSTTQQVALESTFSKAQRVEHWKGFITATDPIMERRLGEVRKFFKKFESAVLNQFGGNIKSHGVFKARNEDDADEIMKLSNYQELIKQYTKEVDEALLEAYSYGLNATLGEFKFSPPDEDAIAFLEKFAAKEVTYISETTRDQMRTVLADAFKQGLSVGDVSAKVREKFTEIEQGRAITIARTETLTAVSMGQYEKQKAFKEEFPEKKLIKQWISSQDDRVRDSHAELDGESVPEDTPFSNGLWFPRDASTEDPSEIINCRCSMSTFAAEDQNLIDETLPDAEENAEG